MEKIFLQDLAEGLANRKHMTKKEADAFVRNVFEIIRENLLSEHLVKVKGLGTFKLITVDSRESVNVNTGERFTIDSHSKITFTPDKMLSDRINKPFADFDTVALNEETKTEDMERIEEVVPPMQATIVDAPVVDTPEVKSPVEDVPEVINPVVEQAPVVKEDLKDEPQVAKEPVVQNEPVKECETVKDTSMMTDTDKKGAEKRGKGWIWVVLFIVIVVAGIYWWWNRPNQSSLALEAQPQATSVETGIVNSQDMDSTTTENVQTQQGKTQSATTESMISAQRAEELAEQYPQVKYGKFWIVGTKATHVMEKGDDLSKLALEYYGDKHLINYIIKYNKLRNPSNIPVGKEILMPELVAKEQ